MLPMQTQLLQLLVVLVGPRATEASLLQMSDCLNSARLQSSSDGKKPTLQSFHNTKKLHPDNFWQDTSRSLDMLYKWQ